jgi:hypothetical protein
MTREFEPDPPNYTPRISGLLFPGGSYMLSILKTENSDASCCLRHFFTYDSPQPGKGHLIHTYRGDGNPLPSFDGEPKIVALPNGGPGLLADILWQSLNYENKVSLYVCQIDMHSFDITSVIKNKNLGD